MTNVRYLIYFLIFILNLASCNNSDGGNGKALHEIRAETELNLSGFAEPVNFYIKNPNYNPSWYAKFLVSSQQISDVELNLKSKRLLNLASYSNPQSSEVPWWVPDINAKRYSYMTSTNSSITVIISNNGTEKAIYVDWTCP